MCIAFRHRPNRITTDSTLCECGHPKWSHGTITGNCFLCSLCPKEPTSQEVKPCAQNSPQSETASSTSPEAQSASNAASAEVQPLRSAATPEELAEVYARSQHASRHNKAIRWDFLAGYKAGREEDERVSITHELFEERDEARKERDQLREQLAVCQQERDEANAKLDTILTDVDYAGGIPWHNARYNDLCLHSLQIIKDNAALLADRDSLRAELERIRTKL